MGRAFSDIAFTAQVRALQTQKGSRAQYAPLDQARDRGDRLGPSEVAFIEQADHFYQATVSETGWPYVQHRGGPAGFIRVMDDKTLGFADFAGNLQYISVGNLQHDDRIAMIFMDYANQRRLKLLGRARTVDIAGEPELAQRLRDPGYHGRIERAFIIEVEGFDWNCPQHITPRFTEEQVGSMTAPLHRQLRHLKDQLALASATSMPDAQGNGELALTVSGMRQLTSKVRAYELRDPAGQSLPAFQAGAHLEVPVLLADGSLGIRCYSITSDPSQRQVYEIAVLREDGGKGGSRAVHEQLRLGLTLRCSLPKNSFALDGKAPRVVFVAGGIGITPIRSMLYEARARGQEFDLHYAARSRRDAAFLEQLAAEFGARVTVYAADEGVRLDAQALLLSQPPGRQFYVCGPARLVDAFLQGAAALGRDPGLIHYERFNNAAGTGANHAITVTLARSRKMLQVPAASSILDVVEAAGIAAPASCRAGACGLCAVKVLEGDPEHRDAVLSQQQRDAGGLMCICVSRANGETLTLDL
ncbi:2Fe-2S iron-sulfur cluster-binding protein [Massilia sp. GCM10020059]|uniref:2Fe-2S iron-sulfur cluster-binding protein n=1 Tax=Massilia agrisoli TaxID=2892444 RepID=A0ABS8ITP9_9BURK|nr:2Fe-2S iron-sulfur cluster-binding protein [Massilia agrisoli]MCC6071975.1 2Fe-2S iron-sulfur cluster-binding protein [Massilia agrisoli]